MNEQRTWPRREAQAAWASGVVRVVRSPRLPVVSRGPCNRGADSGTVNLADRLKCTTRNDASLHAVALQNGQAGCGAYGPTVAGTSYAGTAMPFAPRKFVSVPS